MFGGAMPDRQFANPHASDCISLDQFRGWRTFEGMRIKCSSACLVGVVLVACGGSHTSGFGDADGGAFQGDGGSGAFIDAGGGNHGGGGATVLYAHTSTELFQLDPLNISAPMKPIGKFDCIGKSGGPSSMTDLAVSKDGALFGVSNSGAYPLQVTGTTVHCAATWPQIGRAHV